MSEAKQAKRIYLAGKIGWNDWRWELVRGLEGFSGDELIAVRGFPILSRAVLGRYDYVGPFFMAGEHSGVVGAHGMVDDTGGHGSGIAQEDVTRACLAAVDKCDLLFAWLDCADLHGTLIELGYALGTGKIVAIGYPPRRHDDGDWREELWFPFALRGIPAIQATTPGIALGSALERLGWSYNFDSPLEEAFWQAYHAALGWPHLALTPQHKVLGGRYRLDFAHLPTLTAIELDGFTYHKEEQAFQRDRQRDRELTQAGWTVVRFASQELRADLPKCVSQAASLILSRKKASPSAVTQ